MTVEWVELVGNLVPRPFGVGKPDSHDSGRAWVASNGDDRRREASLNLM